LILDFSGTAGKHRLVGPVDCLLGMGEAELDQDLHDEIERLLGFAQLPIVAVVKQAEDEIARRRAALALAAVVRYRAEHIDPFVGELDEGSIRPVPHAHWTGEPASQRQIEALEAEGITLTKLPRGFSRSDAWKLLAQLGARKPAGLCSYKAARKLSQAGVETRTLTHERAKELLDKLRMGDWRPAALRGEPEVRTDRPALEAFA
jgi:hypothetical protein